MTKLVKDNGMLASLKKTFNHVQDPNIHDLACAQWAGAVAIYQT